MYFRMCLGACGMKSGRISSLVAILL